MPKFNGWWFVGPNKVINKPNNIVMDKNQLYHPTGQLSVYHTFLWILFEVIAQHHHFGTEQEIKGKVHLKLTFYPSYYAPPPLEALVTFSNAHNRFAASQMERIPSRAKTIEACCGQKRNMSISHGSCVVIKVSRRLDSRLNLETVMLSPCL